LGDIENHHARGVHDADDDLGEPDAGIGEMSPGIGKAPDHRSFALDVEPRVLLVGSRQTAVTFRSPLWRSSVGRGTRTCR
jgi:hypothetical protein